MRKLVAWFVSLFSNCLFSCEIKREITQIHMHLMYLESVGEKKSRIFERLLHDQKVQIF